MQVADLKPKGVLHRATTLGKSELQLHLPTALRRQYLLELFPDLSIDANYAEEQDHHQLVVSREEFESKMGPSVSLQAEIDRHMSCCVLSGLVWSCLVLSVIHVLDVRTCEALWAQSPRDLCHIHGWRNHIVKLQHTTSPLSDFVSLQQLQ